MLWAVVFLGVMHNVSHAEVRVKYHHQIFKFDHPPRLTGVLKFIYQQQDWYWPAAALFEQSNKIDAEHAQLVKELDTIIGSRKISDGGALHALRNLQKDLASWEVGKRIAIPLDYDLARLKEKFNPRFDPGSFQLQLMTRPQSVLIEGAVQQSETRSLTSPSSLLSYCKQLPFQEFANKDIVWVVQPDGQTFTVGVAYWNQQYKEIMPGSQIIIPFNDSLYPQLTTINRHLLALAQSRILL